MQSSGKKSKDTLKKPARNNGGRREIVLRVAEAHMKDVGRGIARLDPADLERIGAEIGDLLAITGKRQSVVEGDAGLPVGQRQGNHPDRWHRPRKRAAGLDEKRDGDEGGLRAGQDGRRRADEPHARLRPGSQHDHATSPASSRGAGSSRRDSVRVNLFGARAAGLHGRGDGAEGHRSRPGVDDHPDQRARGAPRRSRPRVSYEDVGGLGKEIHRIREMIELAPQVPGGLRAPGHRCAEGRAAARSAGLRQDADRPRRRQRDRGPLHPRRRARRSSTSSTARARRTCATSSRTPPSTRPASSSWTRSTPSLPSGRRCTARWRSGSWPSCWPSWTG